MLFVDVIVHDLVAGVVRCTQQPQVRLVCQATQLAAHCLQLAESAVKRLGQLLCIQLGG
jgi:hypothetical protein